jgi:hypothetical protein
MESAVSIYVVRRSCITLQSKFQQLQLQFMFWYFKNHKYIKEYFLYFIYKSTYIYTSV